MAQDVPPRVLADKVAKVCAESHICGSTLVKVPFLNWNPLQEDESFALHEIVLDLAKQLSHCRQNEVILGSVRLRLSG